MNDIDYVRRFCRSRRHADDRRDEILIGGQRDRVHAGPLERVPQRRLAHRRGFPEPPPKPLVVGVDVELLAGLGVLHQQGADVGQLDLAPIEQPHGEDFVALGQQAERPLPARRADEIGEDEHERAALDRVLAGLEQRCEVGERRPGQSRLVQEVVDQAQDLDPAAARRDRALDPAAVEDRAHAVPVSRQQARERRDEVDEHAALQPVGLGRAEIDRRAEVEQEPRRDLAVLVVLADVRRVHPRRDVPVDVADVVAVLVFAQVGEVDAVAAEQAPVVALEQPVEPADDLPVEALEDALRRRRGRCHAREGARPAPGCGR